MCLIIPEKRLAKFHRNFGHFKVINWEAYLIWAKPHWDHANPIVLVANGSVYTHVRVCVSASVNTRMSSSRMNTSKWLVLPSILN